MAVIVSVIVPAYNVAPYVGRTLDSILAQTLENLEIVAVDDGSTDGTGAILDRYAGAHPGKIRVLHQENAGVTAARLAGVSAAKGQWIGFVDGDDQIEPDMYERLVRNALEYGADISHCGYRMVFADGRVNWFHNTGLLARQDKLTGLKDLLDGSMIEPGLCNKLFRRDLIRGLLDSGAMPTDIRINEDLLMNYLLFSQAEKSVFEDVCPYHYLVRGDSASRAALSLPKIWDPIRVKAHILDRSIPGLEDDARRAYLSTCINVYNSLMLYPHRDLRQEEPRVRDLLRERKAWLGLLSQKQRLLARLILTVPGLYRYLYRFYARFLQKNPYE